MFIRKKKNKSKSISVQILRKHLGKSVLVETVGCGKDEAKTEQLIHKAKQRVIELTSQQQFDFFTERDQILHDYLALDEMVSVQNIGPKLILENIFNDIGFSKIPEDLFKHIVLARLTYPASKLKTTEYFEIHHNKIIDVGKIYRFLDRFDKNYKEQVEKIVYEHTKKISKNITIVFYDMTTLYFEAEDEDDLRKIGFSKDGKFQNPQIMLGLLVGKDGYPIAYDIFEGNTFEGKTLLPIIEQTQAKYDFKKKPIVTADSGLFSKSNLKKLSEQKYQFIIGARIKNEKGNVKKEILKRSKDLKHGNISLIVKEDKTKLIISYSDKRARKDKYNREKGLKRLKKKIASGKLTKTAINSRGYNKFLKLENEIKIKLDTAKVKEDEKWDGLKGYLTNTDLSAKQVIENYSHLWKIEKAFRISKTDLRIRPIYHYRKRRIEAHICICFAAYTVWKELERLLKKHKMKMSPEKAIEFSKGIYQVSFSLPDSGKTKTAFAKLSEQQKLLLKNFYFG
ncbi:MAG: IS1634 family transposase [Patescibacteria group bacterium]|nr:IS1634 family transposase [Patescibacteria group bacterium]